VTNHECKCPDEEPTCPDCGRPVETGLLHDPVDPGSPIGIWDCSWCQRSGFVQVVIDVGQAP
jgi:hypothetical protein